MTHENKYLKDGVDVGELIEEFMEHYYKSSDTLEMALLTFFEPPVNPTLTEDEKVILRNIAPKFEYIKRASTERLFIIALKDNAVKIGFEAFDHLFQFIQPRRRI